MTIHRSSSHALYTEQCLLRLVFDFYLNRRNYLDLYELLTDSSVRDCKSVSVDYVEDFFIIDVGNGKPLMLYEYTSAKGKKHRYSHNLHIPELAYANQRFIDLFSRPASGIPHSVRRDILSRIPPGVISVTILYSGDDYRPPCEQVNLSEYNNPSLMLNPNWEVNIINLNRGFNDRILSTFKPLCEYMYVVDQMKSYIKIGNPVHVAARKTIEDCRNNSVFRELIGSYCLFVYSLLVIEFENAR